MQRGEEDFRLERRARKTAGIRCFVVGRYLRPAQAMLACLPSIPAYLTQRKKHRNCVPVFLVDVTGLEARKKATKRQFFSYFGAKTAHFYAFCKLCPQLPNIKSP